MVKEFEYRGVALADLEKMPIDKLRGLLGARQRRSLKRGVTDGKRKVIARMRAARAAAAAADAAAGEARDGGGGAPPRIRTHLRDLIVLPFMVGTTVHVYNGKEFKEIEVKPEMIGHYIGEYSLSGRRVSHGAPGVGASRSSLYVPLK